MKNLILFKAFLAAMVVAAGVSAEDVWLETNRKIYNVSNGAVGNVNIEYNYTYTSYIDDKHFEQEQETKTYATNPPHSTYSSNNRNGNTSTYVSHTINTTSDITTTQTVVSDEESGLTSSTTVSYIGTLNGEPYNNSSKTDYAIELLSTEDDVKTYKYYNAETGGIDTYNVYKVQNGVTLESKLYTAGGTLYHTQTNTFPNDAVIRTKLPTFTLISLTTYETTPGSNYYQTCEVVSDSPQELVIRVKNYYVSGVLMGQYESTYLRRSSGTSVAKKAAKKTAQAGFAGIRNGQINLNLKAGTYTAQLYNLQGRLVKSADINAINGINATGLKTDNLSKGIFILNVNQSGASILKQKIAVK